MPDANRDKKIAARITLAQSDPLFADALAERLRAEGHEVVVIDNPAQKVEPSGSADVLELVITQARGRYPGVRLRVLKPANGEQYTSVFGQFLADPVDVERVVLAVRGFVRPRGRPRVME